MDRFFIFFFLCLTYCCVVKGLSGTPNYKYSFEQCLVSKPGSFGTCLGVGALSQLQSIDEDPAYSVVDGITLLRDEQLPRNFGNFLERDPTNFRCVSCFQICNDF